MAEERDSFLRPNLGRPRNPVGGPMRGVVVMPAATKVLVWCEHFRQPNHCRDCKLKLGMQSGKVCVCVRVCMCVCVCLREAELQVSL